jgi:hypothetical protein
MSEFRMVSMVIGPENSAQTLFSRLDLGVGKAAYFPIHGFRDKQRTLVNSVGVQGMQVQVPAREEEACQNITKLIILRRSPKTSLWDSCGFNLHTNTVYRKK